MKGSRELVFKKFPTDYYWTTYQSEWATDILFSDTRYLQNLYQDLIHHGMTTFQSPKDIVKENFHGEWNYAIKPQSRKVTQVIL